MRMTPVEFVQKVVECYTKDKGIFANKINLEELIPEKATKSKKSLYLFYVTQLDYATKSQRLYKGALLLWNKDKNFFNPNYIVDLTDIELAKILKEYLKPRYVNEAVNRYKLNSLKLLIEYEGSPQKIFTNSNTASEALKKVKCFRGFGPKTGNLFVRTVINTLGFSYKDIEEILPPVDVWDVRIAHLMGYVGTEAMTQPNIKNVKKMWSDACKEAGSSWLTFDKALWLLGSEGKPKDRTEILELLQ